MTVPRRIQLRMEHALHRGNRRVDMSVPLSTQAWLTEHLWNKGFDGHNVSQQLLSQHQVIGALVSQAELAQQQEVVLVGV